MSTLYNLEPQPTGKVVLQTTAGDVLLELFAKQAPLASRNFLQHCLDGYYNNTIFHRLVPGFIIQGGDPTGTGSGGISAINDGDPFQDEFHSRLKFNRRGLLGMANEGKDNNGSQFFLTLGSTPELQGKHTMFGRVEGDTIYNLMKMADAELAEGEGSERPLYPTRVTGAEIIVNPFEDMVARAREAPRSTAEEGKKDVKKRKKPAGKNVLSFGVEDGEEELAAPLLKKSKANPKLVQHVEETEKPVDPPVPTTQREKKRAPERHSYLAEPKVEATKPPPAESPPPKRMEDNSDETPEASQTARQKARLDKTNAEIEALKASMKRSANPSVKQEEKPKTLLESMIPSTSTRGRKRGKVSDERDALDLFKAFKARLEDLPPDHEAAPQSNCHTDQNGDHREDEDDEAALCDLHFIANCQSCKNWDGDENADEDEETSGWMAHTLSFAKDTLGKDLEWKRKMEEIEIVDPREKARAIKEERRKDKREKGSGKR